MEFKIFINLIATWCTPFFIYATMLESKACKYEFYVKRMRVESTAVTVT